MIDTSLEAQFHDFRNQSHPTTDETIVNNRSVLYKRKKFFLNDLKASFKMLGIVLIVVAYLRDMSMIRLALRGFVHASLANPFPTSSDNVTLTDENKRALTKFLLVGIFITNAICFITHLIFGTYSNYGKTYLQGGISLQFIGERVPSTRIELLLLDVAVLLLQLTYHSLMCVVDASKVLLLDPQESTADSQLEAESSTKLQLEADGYNGNVTLLSIDLVKDIKTVLAYEEKLQYGTFPSQRSSLNTPFSTPGAFV